MSKSKLFAPLILTLLTICLLIPSLLMNQAEAQSRATMFVHPASIVDPELGPCGNFTVTIHILNVTNLFTWQIKLLFDPSIMECTDAYYPPGHVFDGSTHIPVEPEIDNVAGYVLYGCTLLLDSVDVDQGVLCALEFHVLDRGSSDLTLDEVRSFLLDYDLDQITTTLNGGFFDNIGAHDVAIMNVACLKTVVCTGFSTNISATVENQGDFVEDFNITVQADATIIIAETVNSLLSGTSAILTFTWNTTGFSKGNYTVTASIEPVPGETDTEDNDFTDGWIIISMVGDITGSDGWPDGKCEMRDIGLVARGFGANCVANRTDPRYGEYWHPIPCDVCPHSANCDVIYDGKIDMRDVGLVARHFGEIDP